MSARFSSYIQVSTTLPKDGSMWSNYGITSVQQCTTEPPCTGDCAKGCTSYLNPEQTNDPNLCGHYNSSGGSAACCDVGCGQVENMAKCTIVYKDNCNKYEENCHTGGKLVCKRSCSKRCDAAITSVKSYANFLKYQTVYQGDYEGSCSDQSTLTNYPLQTCIYDVADFQDLTNAEIKSLSTDGVQWTAGDPNYDEIMTQWCAQQVDGPCPPDPITQVANPVCSRYASITDGGNTCREWASQDQSGVGTNRYQGYRDAVGFLYCSKYNTSECACINRGRSSVYRDMKPAFPYNDGCWYKVCTSEVSREQMFQPADVQTGFRKSSDSNTTTGMCPSGVCTMFINSGGDTDTFTGNKLYTNC